MEVKITRKQKASLPHFRLGVKTFERIGADVSEGVVVGIEKGKKVDGSPIRRNADSTYKAKRKNPKRLFRGRVAPLIDREHRFIKKGQGGSWRYWAHEDHVRLEAGSEELKRLSELVQKKGYTGWLGVTKAARRKIVKIVRARLLEIVKKASRR